MRVRKRNLPTVPKYDTWAATKRVVDAWREREGLPPMREVVDRMVAEREKALGGPQK
jgi:hypothetical protein